MRETPQQYVGRILGYLKNMKGKNALRVQLETPKHLSQLVHGVPKRALMKRWRPGKWSVGEILAHLAESEMVSGYRIRMMLSKSGTPIQAIDQDHWARVGRYRGVDPDRALEMFTVLRENNLALLRSLTRVQWSRYGMHEERGKETVRRLTDLVAGHDINHLRQIEGMLKRRRG